MTNGRIAHFRIESELGRGGMGIVYKAEDTKLHRPVALKVLSPHLLSSEDDRARFYREARAAAALNHPNIATVHAVDEATGDDGELHPFIAMEFIDGRSLREVIDQGPLPLDDAIRIVSAIASALNAAHEKGIVHRDVKSANVMMSDNGTVKVLDFGLAKTAQSTMLTKTGSTLGTAAYMSPEQARNENVDHRTDIWSLGVVLYELVTGTLPFGAAYEQAVVYAILNEDPEPFTAIRTGVPMELDRIVTKCLMKDPRLRYQHADDLVADLAAVQLGGSALRTTTTVRAGPERPQILKTGASKIAIGAALAAGLGIGTLVTLLALGNRGEDAETLPDNAPTHRLTLKLPESAPLEPVGESSLAVGLSALDISRDGRRFVYVGINNGETSLYFRELARDDFRKLEGTEGAVGPVFSPDGEWVAFVKGTFLMKTAVSGGRPIELAEVSDPTMGAWSEDGFIYVTVFQGGAIAKMPAGGGSLEILEVNLVGNLPYELPTLMAGGEGLLMSRRANMAAVLFEDHALTSIDYPGGNPRHTVSGHIVFTTPGRLMAAPFDPKALQMTGPPVPVVDGLRTEVVIRAGQYAFSDTGTLIYAPGGAVDESRLMMVDRRGVATPLPFDPDFFGAFSMSPDGSKVAALIRRAANNELWVYDLDNSVRRRVGNVNYCAPVWSPDSARLFYCEQADAGGTWRWVSTQLDGGQLRPHFETSTFRPYDVTPDGRRAVGDESSRRIMVRSVDSPDDTEILVETQAARTWGPKVSPDGRFLSYTNNEIGQSNIVVIPLDGSGLEWTVSGDAGGEEAQWSQDGTELFYSNGTRWYRVPVSTTSGFSFGSAELMFEGPFVNVPGYGYAVFPDAQRFVVLESTADRGPIGELRVIENWYEELNRLAPTR